MGVREPFSFIPQQLRDGVKAALSVRCEIDQPIDVTWREVRLNNTSYPSQTISAYPSANSCDLQIFLLPIEYKASASLHSSKAARTSFREGREHLSSVEILNSASSH